MADGQSSVQLPELPIVEGVEFKHIDGFPGYAIGSDGHARSYQWRKGVWLTLKERSDRGGYQKVNIYSNRKMKPIFNHKLVLTAFVGPRPFGM